MSNCGCDDACNCTLIGAGLTTAVQIGEDWVITSVETDWTGVSPDNTIGITPAGTAFHAPNLIVNFGVDAGLTTDANGIRILPDPASPAAVSVSAAGLSVAETLFAAVSTDGSITSTPAGTHGHAPDIEVRKGAASGLETDANGLKLKLNPASPSALSLSAAGLSVAATPTPLVDGSKVIAIAAGSVVAIPGNTIGTTVTSQTISVTNSSGIPVYVQLFISGEFLGTPAASTVSATGRVLVVEGKLTNTNKAMVHASTPRIDFTDLNNNDLTAVGGTGLRSRQRGLLDGMWQLNNGEIAGVQVQGVYSETKNAYSTVTFQSLLGYWVITPVRPGGLAVS